jgi:hypothetical protein
MCPVIVERAVQALNFEGADHTVRFGLAPKPAFAIGLIMLSDMDPASSLLAALDFLNSR